jgi:hypothetical protein
MEHTQVYPVPCLPSCLLQLLPGQDALVLVRAACAYHQWVHSCSGPHACLLTDGYGARAVCTGGWYIGSIKAAHGTDSRDRLGVSRLTINDSHVVAIVVGCQACGQHQALASLGCDAEHRRKERNLLASARSSPGPWSRRRQRIATAVSGVDAYLQACPRPYMLLQQHVVLRIGLWCAKNISQTVIREMPAQPGLGIRRHETRYSSSHNATTQS